MAETNRSRSSRTRSATADPEAAKGDLPAKYAEAEEKGYFGTVPDQNPNSEYSLEGGPPNKSNAELVAAGSAAGAAAVAGTDETDTDETDTGDGDNS